MIVGATAVVGFAVAGPVGIGLAAGATVAALVGSRYLGSARVRKALIAGAGAGIVTGAALLARAPWPDPLGYAGDGLGPQVATVFGLVCAGLAAGWPSVGVPSGAATGRAPGSRRGDNQRREGSSTSE